MMKSPVARVPASKTSPTSLCSSSFTTTSSSSWEWCAAAECYAPFLENSGGVRSHQHEVQELSITMTSTTTSSSHFSTLAQVCTSFTHPTAPCTRTQCSLRRDMPLATTHTHSPSTISARDFFSVFTRDVEYIYILLRPTPHPHYKPCSLPFPFPFPFPSCTHTQPTSSNLCTLTLSTCLVCLGYAACD